MSIPEELAKRRLMVPRCQSDTPDPVIFAKLYWTIGTSEWYIAEYEPRTGVAYGFVRGVGADEWGYFQIPELLASTIAGIEPIRLRASFTPERASALGFPENRRTMAED